METPSLDKYLQEIAKVDLITPEEEVELAQRIKQGDQVALEKLTKAKIIKYGIEVNELSQKDQIKKL